MPSAGAVAVFSAAVAVAAFVQAVTGFGFALLVMPVTAALVGPRAAIGLVTVVGTVVPAGMAWSQRRSVDRRTVGRVLGAAALGAPVGLVALTRLPADTLRILISVAVLGSIVLLWRGLHLTHAGAGLEAGAGLAAGALATSVGTNGPPIVLALQARHFSPDAFRATLSATFVAINAAVLVLLGVSGQLRYGVLPMAPAALPGLLAGWWVGGRVRSAIPAPLFRRLVLSLLALAAVVSAAAALS